MCNMYLVEINSLYLSLVMKYSVKDIEHERTWLRGSIFEVEVSWLVEVLNINMLRWV